MSDPMLLSQQADQATASGDLPRARALLEELIVQAPSQESWMKLAAMRRAGGDLPGALDAVHGALALAPLDFMGLLSRANLLDKMDDPEADEAYGRALAQRPAGALGPGIDAILAHAETRYSAHQAQYEAKLLDAVKANDAGATADEAKRIARFGSNIVRRTRPWHSEPTHFHYPGLIEREFHDRLEFPWLEQLEVATDVVEAEFKAVAASERAELTPYINYPDHEPLEQWRPLNHSRDWTAIHLYKNGALVEANARHCPKTMEVLASLPQPDIPGCSPNAMFSLLAPGVSIPPHVGVANTRLVCHLPLIVPAGCWFRVGAERIEWKRGEAFVFDDTIEHEASNPSGELRVVFIFDVWHGGLSAAEQDAVRAIMAASDMGSAGTGL